MTTHTDAEFEILRKACHLWQETAQTWEARALKAEAALKSEYNRGYEDGEKYPRREDMGR